MWSTTDPTLNSLLVSKTAAEFKAKAREARDHGALALSVVVRRSHFLPVYGEPARLLLNAGIYLSHERIPGNQQTSAPGLGHMQVENTKVFEK